LSEPLKPNGKSAGRPSRNGGGSLSRELSGDLPCVQCGYNLKGLTVRGMCPECGVSVRTTLLAVVDPRAREFKRVEFPRLTALGVTLWSWAGVAACVMAWILQAAYFWRPQGLPVTEATRALEWVLVASVAASGVGAIAFIRPHAGLPFRWRAMAFFGVLAYIPFVAAVHEMFVGWGTGMGSAFNSATMEPHVPTQLIGAGAGIAILLFLRPNAQALQSRWLLMRIGAVTRQTMLAMIGVVLLWVCADLMVLIAARMHGGEDEILRMIAKLIILVGGIFLTVGVFSIAMDCWRIRAVVLRPPLALEEVLGRSSATPTTISSPKDAPRPMAEGGTTQ